MASAKQGAPHWLSFLAKMWGVLLGIIKIELATINFPIVCVSILLFCRHFNISKWVLFSFVPFYCFLQLKASFPYYYTIATPFYIFFVTYAISIFTKGQIKHSHFATSVIIICGLLYNIPWDRLIFFENKDSENIETGMRLIAKKQFARIVFIGGSNGCELFAQALSGCKYWARQNGTTKEMIDDRNEAIRSRKPDFVVVSKKIAPKNTYALLNDAGYKPCYKFLYKMDDRQSHALLYTKQEFLSKYKPTTKITEK